MFNNTGNNSDYLGMNIPISSANIDGTGLMLNAPVKYTANTNMISISTANSNLDGTGTITDIVTGSGTYGTLVRRITIKAQGNTAAGMIRLFIKPYTPGATAPYSLFKEIEVPTITQAATIPTFTKVIDELIWLNKDGDILAVSTQNAETFIITAEVFAIGYPY